MIFNIYVIGFYYIPGTIPDSTGYNSEKIDKNPSLREENQSPGQWYIETVSGW